MKHAANLLRAGQEVVPPVQSVRVPHITLHAFCETDTAREVFEGASSDRRMSRVQAAVYPDGLRAAITKYQTESSPDLVIVETTAEGASLLEQLDALAVVCESSTKVMVVAYANDIRTYRLVIERGVSDYVVGPLDCLSLIRHVAALYAEKSSGKIGRSFAFIGAKGGVGSSTIAQNVAGAVGRSTLRKALLVDMDVAFGTASLNLDLEERQGTLEAIQDANRLDEVLLDRLMTEYDVNLSVLTAPGNLEQTYDLDAEVFDPLIDVAQSSVPFVFLDVPHVWTAWSRTLLVRADEVIITALPDLANLRNTKHLVELLKRARPNDGPPRLLLNQIGAPKRKDIKPKDFAEAVGVEPIASIPFEPSTFATAAISGKMLSEVSSKSRASRAVAEVAGLLARQSGAPQRKKSWADLLKRRSVK